MTSCRILLLLGIAALVVPHRATDAQSLRGSPASVDLMYTSAHAHELAFLQNRNDIYDAARDGDLQMLSFTEDLALQGAAYPFVLPATKRFADSLAKAYHAGCGQRLTVTSGARPIDEQPPNASPKSVHPTGMAVDFHKPPEPCLTWLRTHLIALEDAHVIEATEEHHPAHFHVAVLNQMPEPHHAILASAASASANAGKTGVANGEIALARTASNTSSARRAANAPPSTTADAAGYRVRAGDNLWTIAQRHNTTVEQLQSLNGLQGSRLRVGQQLKLR